VTTLGRSTLLLNSKAPERMKQSVIIIIIIKNVTITVRDTVISNIAGALYRVTEIKNEMKYGRRLRSVSRQCQLKQPCLQAAPEGKK